jgi:predicted SprT family Zn-dependent metalloprotease
MNVQEFAEQHGIPLPSSVPNSVLTCPVDWNPRLITRLGTASFVVERRGRRLVPGTAMPIHIDLNPILKGTDRLRQTFLHEVAHQCAPGTGHGLAWRSWCWRLGIEPQRCYTAAEGAALGVRRRPRKHRYQCERCGLEFDRARALAANRTFRHAEGCGGLIVNARAVVA